MFRNELFGVIQGWSHICVAEINLILLCMLIFSGLMSVRTKLWKGDISLCGRTAPCTPKRLTLVPSSWDNACFFFLGWHWFEFLACPEFIEELVYLNIRVQTWSVDIYILSSWYLLKRGWTFVWCFLRFADFYLFFFKCIFFLFFFLAFFFRVLTQPLAVVANLFIMLLKGRTKKTLVPPNQTGLPCLVRCWCAWLKVHLLGWMKDSRGPAGPPVGSRQSLDWQRSSRCHEQVHGVLRWSCQTVKALN